MHTNHEQEFSWTMKDKLTNEIRSGSFVLNFSSEEENIAMAKYIWLEGGNWSCDCNRVIDFYEEESDEVEAAARKINGAEEDWCVGLMPDSTERFELIKLSSGDKVIWVNT